MTSDKQSNSSDKNVSNTTGKNTDQTSGQSALTPTSENTGKFTPKRIAAIIGMVCLVSLYIITLLVAIFDTSEGGKWFMISMSATFVIPFLLWIYIWLYGQLTGKKTIADINYNLGPNTKEESNDEENS